MSNLSLPSYHEVTNFQIQLLSWHQKHGRHHLPWQVRSNPYKIWVSEIMLQQTQVVKVIPYFERFIFKFPTIGDLASAELSDVMQIWSGLGYYSRAINLHKAAGQMCAKHQQQVPNNFPALIALPGIGRSTANAILSQAFHQPVAILDGNVRRILSRLLAVANTENGQPISKTNYTNRLWTIAEKLASHNPSPKNYTQAIMDFGAMICTRKPKCLSNSSLCPFHTNCRAFQNKSVDSFPPKKPSLIKKQSSFIWLILCHKNHIALQRRLSTGIWPHLWCLPEFVPAAGKTVREVTSTLINEFKTLGTYWPITPLNHSKPQQPNPKPETFWSIDHELTHQRLNITPLLFWLTSEVSLNQLRNHLAVDDKQTNQWGQLISEELEWIPLSNLTQFGMPSPAQAILQQIYETIPT